jgi:hypothetical protein
MAKRKKKGQTMDYKTLHRKHYTENITHKTKDGVTQTSLKTSK